MGPNEIRVGFELALAVLDRAAPLLDDQSRRRYADKFRLVNELPPGGNGLQRFILVHDAISFLLAALRDRTPSPDVVALLPDLMKAERLFDELIALGLSVEFD